VATWGSSRGWNATMSWCWTSTPVVVGIASQPFWLSWTDDAGKRVSHVPDYFARHTDGTAVVIDCRPVELREPRDVAKFDATARACALVGWEGRPGRAQPAQQPLSGRHHGEHPRRSAAEEGSMIHRAAQPPNRWAGTSLQTRVWQERRLR
jgi:hypothetical protein